ncbi:MAG: molybdopterin molybdotransferase MoeA [Acetobacter sp.]
MHLPRSTAVIEKTPVPSMVDYDCAQAILSALAETLHVPEIEYIQPSQAAGRILARDLHAVTPRPEADISAMDGYAFCCADIATTDQHHATILLKDYIVAGDQPEPHHKGTAATILTGARLPVGADCVIARERVEISNGMLRFAVADMAVGKNIRRAGEEFTAGLTLLNAGQKLDWRHIALLASQNIQQLAVYKPCRVGVLGNGAEFAADAQDSRAEINTPMLSAMLAGMGVQVVRHVVGSDSQQDLLDAVVALATQSDILITTGGISVGQTDNVLPVMEQLGASCVFRRAKIRPGKPFTVMLLGKKPVFCLPGNPGAAALCAQVFVMPFLHALTGAHPRQSTPPLISGRSSFSFSSPADATCFVPVRYAQSGKEGVFSLVPSQGSSDVLCFSHSSGILRIPAGAALNVGDWCAATPFGTP